MSFVPREGMVMQKVMTAAESPQDVANGVVACKAAPTEGVEEEKKHLHLPHVCDEPFGLAGTNCRTVV